MTVECNVAYEQYKKISCQFWSLKENKLLAIINSQKSNTCAWHSGALAVKHKELNLDAHISYKKPCKKISDGMEDEGLRALSGKTV